MIQRKLPGHTCAEQAAEVLQLGQVCVTAAAAKAMQSQGQDDGRVAEGEEKSDAERLLPLLEHQADGIVDGRDVVGIERMAQAEHVRHEAEPNQRRDGPAAARYSPHPAREAAQ